MKRKFLSILATGVFLVGMSGKVFAIPIVDQSNPYAYAGGSGPSISSQYFYAQTVTNGITGNLASIELGVTRHVSTSSPLIVQIRGVFGDEPSDNVLIEKIIDPAEVGFTISSTTSIDFSLDNLFLIPETCFQ